MQPPKTGSRFLFYTNKNIYLKKKCTFLHAYKVKKKTHNIIHISDYMHFLLK